jgi:hypothetical protein
MATALTAQLGYASNSIPGLAMVGGDIDLYQVDSTQKFSIGQQITRADGNKYRYASFNATVTQGKTVSPTIADTFNTSTDALLLAPASTYQQGGERAGLYPGAIGSRFVVMTLASVIKDQFAGGYITMNKDTGVGYTYRIKGNDATGDHYASKILIELYDPIVVAIDATTDSGIVGNIYNDLVICSQGTDYLPVGVTMASMTAGKFGWICTAGVCACLQSDTSVAGDIIQCSATVDGAYSSLGIGSTGVSQVILAGRLPLLGICLQIPAGNGTCYGTIKLQLE